MAIMTIRRVVALLGTVAVGLVFAFYALPTLFQTGWAITVKLRNRAPDCTWNRVFTFFTSYVDFGRLQDEAGAGLSVLEEAKELDLKLVTTKGKRFWIKRGSNHVAYQVAEHEWFQANNPANSVRPGDVVLDCGANVGVFTRIALDRGATKVVAIDPDPTNIECLRRTFPKEVAEGKVLLEPRGVWSNEQVLKLHLGRDGDTSLDSVILETGGGVIDIPVTTIDRLVEYYKLERVNFIKMDIEGAEREALRGAAATLRKFRPRLMLDAYHRPDDLSVLPAIIRESHADYRLTCGPCEVGQPDMTRIIPHVIYFE